MKKDRRKRDIKSKLVAAIAMLMVSCIMVVSSTYAWFTLSTAPEVTGISTAIGANGNLEMALLPNSLSVTEALAAIGGNNANVNNTWGNIVNLKGNYGLEDITLYPATLGQVTANGELPGNFLAAPTYGADGRVSGLNTSMLNMAHTSSGFNTAGFGVRALGTSSGMSGHEMAYRSALVAADTAFDGALAASKGAVTDGGSVLADIAVAKSLDDNATFTQAEVKDLITAYGYVDTALDKIEEALKRYIIADYLATAAVDDSNYADTLATMEKLDLAGLIAGNYAAGITTVSAMQTALTGLRSTVDTHVNALKAMTGDSYVWDDLSSHVTPLADVSNMQLNGYPISEYLKEGGQASLGSLTNGERKLVVNHDGSDTTGLFVGLANFVNSFSTPATFEEINYGGLSLKNVTVTMVINKTAAIEPAYLKVADDAATAADITFGSAANNIDSFYGFIIDMAFRTNVADSSLLLQTDAIDRIYADNSANPNTMGGGSTMTYEATNTSGYSTTQLVGLMENIRIVLFDPATLKVLGYARLDASEFTTKETTDGFSVTMPIKMWDETTGAWAVDAEGKEDATIIDLAQNTATAVSAMVYLEGKDMTNADIGNANVKGTMNLQFASSAELKPMEYGDLRKENGGAIEDPGTTAPAGTIVLTNVTSADSASYPVAGALYTNGVIALTITNADANDDVTVTIGENTYTATYTETDGKAGWVVGGFTETIEANTAISVAVTANP